MSRQPCESYGVGLFCDRKYEQEREKMPAVSFSLAARLTRQTRRLVTALDGTRHLGT